MFRLEETPFDSIESAHEYVGLMIEVLTESRSDLQAEVERAAAEGAGRRREALLLAAYKLDRLERHLMTSRRLLNDLRSLRRLLLEERHPLPEDPRPSAGESGRRYVTGSPPPPEAPPPVTR